MVFGYNGEGMVLHQFHPGIAEKSDVVLHPEKMVPVFAEARKSRSTTTWRFSGFREHRPPGFNPGETGQ